MSAASRCYGRLCKYLCLPISFDPRIGRRTRHGQAARAQKGLPDGVGHYQGGFRAQLIPKKNTYVTLAAPGGGSVFGTAKAAAKAIKDYEDAGSPTTKSHPLVKNVNRS